MMSDKNEPANITAQRGDGAYADGSSASGPSGMQAYRTLRALASRILTGDNLEVMLEQCATTIQELLAVDACTIYLIDHRARMLVPTITVAGGRVTTGTPLPLDVADGRVADALKHGRSLLLARDALVDGEVILPLPEAQSLLTGILVPLPVYRGMSGLLWLGRVYGAAFTPEEQELAQTIASMTALALRSNQSERHLQDVLQCDHLTGLLNRSVFQDNLARKLQDSAACALLLLDFDHFKRFNDSFGHHTGDDLLRAAGQLLREELRAGDEAFRYSAEELAIILADATAAEAVAVAERLRSIVKDLRVGDAAQGVTVSIGVATAPDDATETDTLIARANAALAEAKRSGRDRVVRARTSDGA